MHVAKHQLLSLAANAVNSYHEGSSITGAETTSVQFSDREEGVPMLSVVVPFYNEQGNVAELHHRLHAVLEETGWSYELLFVDDGSTDSTSKLLRELATVDPLLTVIRLRRNFGQTAALAAGFAHTSGTYVIAMDGDLQHAPEEIPIFLNKLLEGFDVVSGWRSRRLDNLWLRRIPSRCANWLMAKLSGVDIHDFGTTFKAYRGDLLRQLPLYGEMHRFIPAIASGYGASICEVPITIRHRTSGVSHYNLSRTFRVMFDLMTIWFLLRYLSRPLHFFGRLGVLNAFAGSAIAFWLLMQKLVNGTMIAQQHGPLMAFAAVLILAGMLMLAFGLLGELSVWQYFNPSARAPYSIANVVRVQESSRAD
jgi:glycosyltransferase involved in cell wall biosynthesis